jgi:putative methionine-R-sulfoxide reductase with GAF domain/HAMP domain-containing protein
MAENKVTPQRFLPLWLNSFRNRLAGYFALLASLVLLFMLTSSFISFRQQSRALYQERLLGLINIIALQQDGDLHANIQAGDEESDAYQQIRAQNAALLATNPDIAYIYTMRRNQQGELYFVVDTDETTDPPLEAGLAIIGQIYDEAEPGLFMSFDTDHPIVGEEFYTDEWGTFLSAYARFYRSDGTPEGIVGIDIRADDIIATERTFLLTNIGLFLLVLPLIVLGGWLLGNRMAAPIENLAQATSRLSAGNFSYTPIESTIPEINRLDQSLLLMARQLEESVGNLETRVTSRTRALQASIDVGRHLSTLLDQDELVNAVVTEVQAAFNYYHVHIYLYDENSQQLVLAGGTGDLARKMLAQKHRLPLGQGLVGKAAATKTAVLAPNVRQNPNWLPNPLLAETEAEVAVPIILGTAVLGVLDVQQNQVNSLSETDSNLLQSIANQMAAALNNARIYRQTQRQAEREMLINKISQQLQYATTVEAVLQIATEELGQAVAAEQASIHLQSYELAENGRIRQD